MFLDRFDDLDRALLHALQIDGRASFRRIGEVLGTSDQTVARRYAALRRTHALRVVGLSDPAPANPVHWVVWARARPEAAGEISDALARRPDTSWIDVCSGGTDIVSAAHGMGVERLLLDALPHTRHVLDVRADRVLHTFYGGSGQPFTKNGPLTPLQVAELVKHLPPPTQPPARLDDADLRLLAALRGDGRAAVENLMAASNMSASGVRRRLRALRAGGVLQLDVDADFDLLEVPVRTLLRLNVDVTMTRAVGRALAEHDEVAFAAATTGSANIFATVLTRDIAALYHYLTAKIAAVPGVGAVETTPVLRHVKSAVTRYAPRTGDSGTPP